MSSRKPRPRSDATGATTGERPEASLSGSPPDRPEGLAGRPGSRQTVSLRAPFAALDTFPAKPLTAGSIVWRVVADQHADEPWWFGRSGDGRFDLHPHSGRGTCYVAADAVGAVLERLFRQAPVEARLVVTPVMTTGSHLQQLSLPVGRRLAALHSRAAVGFGVTREIATTTPYVLPQWWAQALDRAGFDGLVHALRHDPEGDGYALFWERDGARSWPTGARVQLDVQTLRRLLADTGVRVLRPPRGRGDVTIADP